MAANYSVKVVGLKEAVRAIKQLGDFESASELKAANLAAATIVAAKASSTAGQVQTNHAGGIARMGPAAGSIRPRASQRNASVAGGGAKYPWFGGSEFGSHGGVGKRQFPGAGGIGYNIYPAIISEREKYIDEYEEAVNKVITRLGLAA